MEVACGVDMSPVRVKTDSGTLVPEEKAARTEKI
jgi:hypothetical protein